MVRRRLAALALAVVHCATGAAAGAGASDLPPPRQHSRAEAGQYRAWRKKAVEVLTAQADANSLATAAALSFVGSGPRGESTRSAAALDLAAHASELAPQNAGIGWLRLSLCAETSDCDIRDVATVMRWVDADNGAAWLPTLAAARRDKDTTEVDRVLADMARGSHFDLYWNRIIVLMFDALDRVRGQLPGGYAASDSTRFTTVSSIAASEFIPAFAPLVDVCRESQNLPERRELCLKLSKTMQRSDTIIAQMTGFNIERRLVAPDGKEARAIGDRRHLLEWRVAAAEKFDTPLLPWMKGARVRARLAHMRVILREEDVCIAILREHKSAVEPPEPHP